MTKIFLGMLLPESYRDSGCVAANCELCYTVAVMIDHGVKESVRRSLRFPSLSNEREREERRAPGIN